MAALTDKSGIRERNGHFHQRRNLHPLFKTTQFHQGPVTPSEFSVHRIPNYPDERPFSVGKCDVCLAETSSDMD
ncbi:hypothetical protein ACFL3Q_16730 [Planctomycetota bacterium]